MLHTLFPLSWCGGCLSTRSGWFKHVEPPRTFSNKLIAETARCVEFFNTSSGWFGSTELSLATALQGTQGVEGASLGWCVEPPRT